MALSSNGFIIAAINYCLSGEAKFPAAIEDCTCAIRFVRANTAKYGIDPKRVGAVGSSAGAQLALFAGVADEKAGFEGAGGWPGVSSRLDAVALLKGVSDFSIGAEEAFGGPEGAFLWRPIRIRRLPKLLYSRL